MTTTLRRVTVVVVGQTPPPWHGQAVLIDQLVHAQLEGIDVVHVRMAFSQTDAEIGRVSARKLAHLASVLARAGLARYRNGSAILYYPPAGGGRVPVLRDLVLLSALRRMFPRVVFHFHAAGVANVERQLPRPLQEIFRRAYYGADLAIVPSEQVTDDAERLRAKSIVVIPPGLPDAYPPFRDAARRARAQSRAPRVLYVGRLSASKGVLLLVDSIAELRRRDVPATLVLVGAYESEDFRAQLERRLRDRGLESQVELRGVLTGPQKWQMYADADLLCFPTFYEAETFGLVALEAMQFELPVIATRFRSLPSIVTHGSTGLLVAPNEGAALTDALAELCSDPARRRTMGDCGRVRYLEHFGYDDHMRRIATALASV